MSYSLQILVALLLLSLLVSYGNLRLNLPLVAILNRWARWILLALLVAAMAHQFSWTYKPFWVVALSVFLGWFLLETIYNWVLISALSRSPIPLFPRFRNNTGGDEWPAQRKFIELRDWLRSQGFKKLQSIKAELDEALPIRASIYQEENGQTRCQIIFFPVRGTGFNAAYILSSQTREGERVITENVFLPFGGYYPDNWFVERRPLIRSLEKLLKLHRRRLVQGEVNVEAWDDHEPLEEINRQQSKLEDINRQYGFLLPSEYQEEHGRISWEGRYRLWKEIWLLNYFGITVGR